MGVRVCIEVEGWGVRGGIEMEGWGGERHMLSVRVMCIDWRGYFPFRAHLKAYGDIYFRSWRFASGPYLKVRRCSHG